MAVEGVVQGDGAPFASVRAVRDGRVVARTEAGSDGRWALADTAGATTVVVAARDGVAAVARPLDATADVSLPGRRTVRLLPVDPPRGAVLTLDPTALAGLAAEHLPVLRDRGDGVVALHLVEVGAAPGTTVRVQDGTYRLAGGVVGMPLGHTSWRVAAVVDGAGRRTDARDGVVEVTVDGDVELSVVFAPVGPADGATVG